MNWGKKIAMLYSGFVLFILFMVFMAASQSFHLVSEEYYEEELAFQTIIDASEMAFDLKPVVEVQPKEVVIQFPAELPVAVQLHFYSPQSAKKDRKMNFENLKEGPIIVPRKTLLPGRYTLKMKWENGQRDFYQEVEIEV